MRNATPETLLNALKSTNGKLVLISGTLHGYFVFKALCHGLKFYCEVRKLDLQSYLPPENALKFHKSEWWGSEQCERTIDYLCTRLEFYAPEDWHFHQPIYGINLDYGFYRTSKFEKKKRNLVYDF